MKTKLQEDFSKLYHKQPDAFFFAPGRVNLIGEHTDYNGGMVFPCAITYGTYAAVSPRDDTKVRFYSNNFKDIGIITVDLHDLHYEEKDNWANYAKGVLYYIAEHGYSIPQGMDILIEGNIPNGAGLSSSASLEVLMGLIFNEMYQLQISMIDIIKISQEAENKFIGMNCGIMDQFIIGMGKCDHAIALNTATLEYTYAPVKLEDSSIVIMNTNKQRGLADSKYNERRSECERALAQLQESIDIPDLCSLTPEEFEAHKAAITNDIDRRRAKHAVYENDRVKRAINALEQNDLTTFGELMNASHISLRDDYEVTGIELDTLVESAWQQAGTIGARMTGAGFGGCAIALVKNDKLDSFKEAVAASYTAKIGYAPTFYIASVGDGAKRV